MKSRIYIIGLATAICLSLIFSNTEAIEGKSKADISIPISEQTCQVKAECIIGEPACCEEKIVIENIELLARVVFAESGNQSYKGKILVAATIKNRSEQWNITPTEAVTAKDQYAKPYDIAKIKTNIEKQQHADCIKAITEVFNSNNTYDDVLYFCNPKLSNEQSLKWFNDNLVLVTVEGDHYFYKSKEGK